MVIFHVRQARLPPGTEARLAGFTELTATRRSPKKTTPNAQARVELRGFSPRKAGGRCGGGGEAVARGGGPWGRGLVVARGPAEAGQLAFF